MLSYTYILIVKGDRTVHRPAAESETCCYNTKIKIETIKNV